MFEFNGMFEVKTTIKTPDEIRKERAKFNELFARSAVDKLAKKIQGEFDGKPLVVVLDGAVSEYAKFFTRLQQIFAEKNWHVEVCLTAEYDDATQTAFRVTEIVRPQPAEIEAQEPEKRE